jgi:hypothetical protein
VCQAGGGGWHWGVWSTWLDKSPFAQGGVSSKPADSHRRNWRGCSTEPAVAAGTAAAQRSGRAHPSKGHQAAWASMHRPRQQPVLSHAGSTKPPAVVSHLLLALPTCTHPDRSLPRPAPCSARHQPCARTRPYTPTARCPRTVTSAVTLPVTACLSPSKATSCAPTTSRSRAGAHSGRRDWRTFPKGSRQKLFLQKHTVTEVLRHAAFKVHVRVSPVNLCACVEDADASCVCRLPLFPSASRTS